MRLSRPFLFAAFFAAALAARCGSSEDTLPGLEGIPDIVAEVNGTPIRRTELIRELVGSKGWSGIDRLIRRNLVEQAAAAQGVKVSDEEIEQQFQSDKRDIQIELNNLIDEKNEYKKFSMEEIIRGHFQMTIEEYKRNVIRQRLLIRRCIAGDIRPSEQELRGFYLNYPDLFQQPTKYRASHILISPLDPRDAQRSMTNQSPLSRLNSLRRNRESFVGGRAQDAAGAILPTAEEYMRREAEQTRRQKLLDLRRDHRVNMDEYANLEELDPAWQMTLENARKILRQLQNGQLNWDQAVKQYSQDPHDQPSVDPNNPKSKKLTTLRERMGLKPGDIGEFHKNGPVVPEFYKGAKDIPVGKICKEPIQTPYGFHIIKMLEVKAPKAVDFEEVRAKVERMYLEHEIQLRSEAWLALLATKAQLTTNRLLLWPPIEQTASPILGPGPGPRGAVDADPDPIVGEVNGTQMLRSEVWRDLLRSDGEESLNRLINVEVVMGMLKENGLSRLEYDTARPKLKREMMRPPAVPIKISSRMIDTELTDDRIRCDEYNTKLRPANAPELSFGDYIFQRYGQTEKNYRRAIEAGLVLREAVKRKVPLDEKTLQVQFAMALDLYSDPASFEVSHILIVPANGMDRATTDAHLQAKYVAEEAYRMFVAKTPFKELVKLFSMDTPENKAKDGQLGQCFPTDVNPNFPFSDVIYNEIVKQNLEKGQLSRPFRTPRGYHLVMIDRARPERRAQFHEVKKQLERDYLMERAKMYTDLWLRSLTKQAKIKRFIFTSGKEMEMEEDEVVPDNFTVPK